MDNFRKHRKDAVAIRIFCGEEALALPLGELSAKQAD